MLTPRVISIVVAIVMTSAACAGTHVAAPRTRLNVTVYRGHSSQRFTLTCNPSGGSAPDQAAACRALEDFLPRSVRSHTFCSCTLYVNRIVVRGVLDGRELSEPVEVSACAACGLGDQASGDATRAFAAFHLPPG
jgi:hypothetical protein